jgi:membrane-bound metal-dependent hydrolase YbcI (DUF457 family)
MDTITHGIVGALTGKALFAGQNIPANSSKIAASNSSRSTARSSVTARVAIVACTLGSILPDIDIFAGTIARNPLALMEWHRNITHSLVLLPLWALLLAIASVPLAQWLRWQRPSFPALVGIYATGLATHVFLDVVTNFGTMIWSPLQYSRAAWDWLYILDLTLTAFALVPQLVAWCYQAPGKFPVRASCTWVGLTVAASGGYILAKSSGYPFSVGIVVAVSILFAAVIFAPRIGGVGFHWRRASWCRAGLALVCVYLASAAAMHRKALANVDSFVAAHDLRAENRAALPLPPTLTHWAGVITTPEGVWRTTFHVPGNAVERTQLYASAESDPHVEVAKKLRDVQVYLWFARFPVWRVQQRGAKTVVEISAVRFFREDGPGIPASAGQPKTFGGTRTNSGGFTFQIVFDVAGNVISDGFKRQ